MDLVKYLKIFHFFEAFENLTFFSISILSYWNKWILKRWNFLDKLDFKNKTLTIFITRSHFLSIWNNMTRKQQINHGAIQKVRDLHLLFTKINELWNGRQEHFSYVWLLHYIILYQRSRKSYFVHNYIFRPTCICKQSILTRQCNYNIFCASIIQLSQIHWQTIGCVSLVSRCI